MSYTFRVVFDGVCAYVPDKPFFLFDKTTNKWTTCENLKSLAVLLPDLRRPGETCRPDKPGPPYFPVFREPHFPLLQFRMGDLRKGTTRRVDLVCRDIAEADERGLLFLRREQIRISLKAANAGSFSYASTIPYPKTCDAAPSGSEGNSTGHSKTLPSPDPSDREQLDSLWWLPDLQHLTREHTLPKNPAVVDRSFLPSYRGPFPDGLIARAEIRGGHLRTFDFNRSTSGEPLVWRFAPLTESPGDDAWGRAIGNSLALEFYDVTGEVQVELKRLANDVATRTLVLAPKPGASSPVLEVEISNREPDVLFAEEGYSRRTLPDMDFQAFYERLALVPRDNVPQLPVPYPSGSSFFGIREKPCAGGSMLMATATLPGDDDET